VHAVVVRSTLNDFDQARNDLKERVIPSARQRPGFVAGQWVRLDDTTGTAMLTFETEEAARGAAEALRTDPPVGVTVNSVEIGEVIARV
jgi:hypothetical protein